jgi:hypothetical protein
MSTQPTIENNLLAAAMVESLRLSVPQEKRNALIDSLFERAKTALISVDALQNEVLRLMQENERLSAKVAELEAKLG